MSHSQARGGHQISPAQCLAHSGRSINLVVPSPSHRVLDGAAPVALNYADNLQVVEEGEIKRSLTQPISALDWRSWTPSWPNSWLCRARVCPASGCCRGGGDSLGHASEAEPPSRPAAAAEGGAGRARVSETEPQVAAGARLGPSSGGEWIPTNPPGPRSPACARTVTRSPGGHRGQRRGGAWGDGEQGWGGCTVGAPASPR